MKKSAGIIAYRKREHLEVLLVHPGGPYFAKKDEGSWTIPKGEYEDGEEPLKAAQREFFEETGQELHGTFIALKPIKQKSGKVVCAWATSHEVDEQNIRSNLFTIEWPPRSGQMKQFPEVDKAEWFTIEEAKRKIIPAQIPLLEELAVLSY